MKFHPANWFLAKDKQTNNDLDFWYISNNVKGRFEDAQVLDGPMSRQLKKATYKPAIRLVSKFEKNAGGYGSADEDSYILRFDAYPQEAKEKVSRFIEAWKAYLTYRTTPAQPGEAEVLGDLAFKEPEAIEHDEAKEIAIKKRGRPRKTGT